MATWRWADLSTVAKLRPVAVATSDPFAYGIPVCDDGGPGDFDTGGCPILVGRVVYNVEVYDEGHIYELSLDGQWHCNDLSNYTGKYPAPWGDGGDPSAYVSIWQGDFVCTVNYVAGRSVVQLILSANGWFYQDISSSDGPRPAARPAAPGSAFGYWDNDNGVNRVVYRGYPPDNEIYELAQQSDYSWACASLSALSTNAHGVKPAPPAASNPFGYCYGVPRVVYTGTDNHVYELRLESSGWKWADLLAASGGAPKAASAAHAYVPDVARVIYTDINDQIIELALDGSWKWKNLSTDNKSAPAAPAAADKPFGYVAFDGVPRVIYRGVNGHIYELHADAAANYVWKLNDLSAIAKATSPTQLAAGNPFGYLIGDGIPRVVYRGNNGHICELALY